MTKRFLTLLAASLLAAPVMLQAQSISLAGGLTHPVSTLGDGEQSGYNAAVGFNFGAPLIPLGARIEGSINGLNHKNNIGGDTRIMNVTANAIFSLGMPYIIGGLGYYNTRVKVTSLGVTNEVSTDGLGVNVGGGLRIPLGALSPFVEARYHQMLGDRNKNIKFVPITFGIQF